MNIKNRIYIACFALQAFATYCHSQNPSYVDSLRKVVSTAVSDTQKISALHVLSGKLLYDDPQQAIGIALQALDIAKNKHDEFIYARSLSEAGRAYDYANSFDSAFYYYSQSLALFKKLNKPYHIVQELNRLGSVRIFQGNYGPALNFCLQALKEAETTGFTDLAAKASNNIGNIYYNKNDVNNAIKYWEIAAAAFRKNNDLKSLGIALSNIGAGYQAKKEYDKALTLHRESYEIQKQQDNKGGMAAALTNIAYVYSDQKKYVLTVEVLKESISLLESVDNKTVLTSTLNNLATAYYNLKQYDKAIEYYNQSISLSYKCQYLRGRVTCFFGLAKLYAITNEYKKAYEYYMRYSDVKDSLLNEENTKQLNELQTQYDSERKDNEIKMLNKDSALQTLEIKRQRIISFGVALVLLLVTIMALIVYRGYKAKNRANKLLEQYNKEITDSISYALRIQKAILPSIELIYKALSQSFIVYKPKDVVSGDFYAFAEKDGQVILAAIDCTGHGVPGAFMSMIGHNMLTEIIVERGIVKPGVILSELNKAIRKALKQDEGTSKDGMDAAIVAIDLTQSTLAYSGANRPLWLIRNGILNETKATKCAIGGHTEVDQIFENHEIQLQKGDTIYLSTDGYADQFGGAEGKKMMTKQFKEMLINIQHLDMRQQEVVLNKAFEDWKGAYEQVDDVLVIGVRV